MTFDEAKRVKLTGGCWDGKTIAHLGHSREGLYHLKIIAHSRAWPDDVAEAARVFLSDESTRRREEFFRSTPRLSRWSR